jgi:hypothetical protein
MPAQLRLFGPEFRYNKHWPEVPICSCVETHPQRPFISDGPGHDGIGWHGDLHCPNITHYNPKDDDTSFS